MDALGQKIVEEQSSSPCIFVHELQVALPKSSSFSSRKAKIPQISWLVNLPPHQNYSKGLIAGLIKGNQWYFNKPWS